MTSNGTNGMREATNSILKRLALIILGLFGLTLGFFLLYLVKSAVGINLFEDKHLWDFIPFLGNAFSGNLLP